MVKEHIPSADELLEALGLKTLSSEQLVLKQFQHQRILSDLDGNLLGTYAKKRPLHIIA